MSSTGPIVTLSPADFDAVLFDLDGVLTRTATVHAAAWKKLFDEFLAERARVTGDTLAAFDDQVDYRRYVDGKPRLDGVRSFLGSRGIELPEGDGDDDSAATVRGLGARKDRYFMTHLTEHGVATFEPAIELIRCLRRHEILTAVVSSSRNCEAVLEAAGIAGLFDARVDGNDVVRLGLSGKPAPDAFLEAARRLDVEAGRAVVVEDAVAGVEAGNAGAFSLVIGIDNHGDASPALREAGADVVVTSLAEVQVSPAAPSAWTLVYDHADAAREGKREALCALGNGYFCTRGAMPWARADGVHYPGTYLAGGYSRLRTDIAGRVVENEDLVNLPNWLVTRLRFDGEDWFDEYRVTLISFRQELDLREATLRRFLVFEHGDGRRTRLEERRLVSMASMHLAAVELRLVPENWSGRVQIEAAIDGTVVNAGARLYEHFDNRHLVPVESAVIDEQTVLLHVRTSQSNVHVAEAVRTRACMDGHPLVLDRRAVRMEGYVGHTFEVELRQGRTLCLEKVLCLHTSRDDAISEAVADTVTGIHRAPGFAQLAVEHGRAWRHLWRRFDVHLRPASGFNLNMPMLLRLNMLHLLQAASPNSIGRDIGVPARGWTGEAYQGHIFWDELFIFPTLNFRSPEITRSLLMYRYRRLEEARAAARATGFAGAMFPWQSGSNGREETQELNFNPHSGRWMPDNTWLQRHVGSAVAWNVWQYYSVTLDTEFLHTYGALLILEIARFWSSAATFNDVRGRYEIRRVMGPDEFHDAYPGATTPGIDNSAYTNVMAVWVLLRAQDVLERLPDVRRSELVAELGITAAELARWDDISRRMFVPFDANGVICQFEGWQQLRELDWERYRARYGNIQRLELILEAENDSANNYKVAKQPDVLMLFYLFSSDELGDIFRRLGYPFGYETIPRNVEYYDCRSSHGSTLSRVVHAWVLARSDRRRAMRYFAEALQSDVNDIQQGTTAEGIHLGAMAGTVDLIQRVATGINVVDDVLHIEPRLPLELARLDLRIRYRGHWLDLRLTPDALTLRDREGTAAPVTMAVNGAEFSFETGVVRTFRLQPSTDRTAEER